MHPLEGVIVPVITPVNEHDQVDETSYRAVIRRCMRAGVNGIFAGGSAGMGPMLTPREWRRAMEIAHDEVRGRCVLLGGVMATSTRLALERIRVLDKIGFAAMVVTPTYYITLSRAEEFTAHFGACRNATDMEMVLYNIPQCTGSNIPLDVLRDAAHRGWSQACKESAGNRYYFRQLLKLGQDYGLKVFQGNEADIQWALSLKASGLVPVCANIDPETFVKAWRAAQAGDSALLSKAQKRILALRRMFVQGDKNWIAGIMYGVARLGIGSGRPIMPLQPLSPEARAQIERRSPPLSISDT